MRDVQSGKAAGDGRGVRFVVATRLPGGRFPVRHAIAVGFDHALHADLAISPLAIAGSSSVPVDDC